MRLTHVLVGVLLACGSAAALAASPASFEGEMGASQPHARDLSKSSHWHAYRFLRDGIEYIQINDTVGQVRMGFGTANGIFIVLPMGSDAARVATPGAPSSSAIQGQQVVYQDAGTTVESGFNSAGEVVWTVTSTGTQTAAPRATAETVCDPNDCPINRVTTTQATAATVCDPNDCPINRVTTQAAALTVCDPNDCPINRVTTQ